MLSFLLELAIVAVIGAGSGALARRVHNRRATRRAAGLAASGTARFPCRISWPEGTGKKAFVYGKVVADADGQLTFTRRRRSPVPLPRSAWIHSERSWHTELVTLRYAVPGQGDVRMKLNEKDAETVEGLLRAA